MMLLLGIAAWWLQKTTFAKEAAASSAFFRTYFQERVTAINHSWKTQADSFRVELEYLNLLRNHGDNWLDLKMFLAVRQGINPFNHIIVTDKTGQLLFHHGTNPTFPDNILPLKDNSGWHYFAPDNSLLYAIVLDIGLQNAQTGHLIVFFPLDNALLRQIAVPETFTAVLWQKKQVANSQGHSAISEDSNETGIHAHGETINIQESFPWSNSSGPTLLVHKHIKPLFTETELLLALVIIFLFAALLLYLALGSWLLRTANRVKLLGQVSYEFSRHNSRTPPMVAALTAIKHAQNDEITAVALSMDEMTSAIENRILERRLHEKQLSESERRLREITSDIADGVFVIDNDGNLTFLNPQGELLLGWKEAELLGKNSHDLFHHLRPDGSPNPGDTCNIHLTVKSKQPYRSYEDYFVRRDGSFLPVALAAAPIMRDDTVVGAVITFQDNTERLLAEKNIRESQIRFYQLFNSARDAKFVVAILPDRRFGNFLEINDAACQRYGYSREEMLLLTPTVINPPECQHDLDQLAESIVDKQQITFERWHISRDGRRIPVEVSSQLFEYKGQMAVLSSARDISERKHAEEMIRENEHRFRTLAHSLRDAILVFDTKETIVLLNRGGERMFGYSESDLLTRPVATLFPNRPTAIPWFNQLGQFKEQNSEGFSITKEGIARHSEGSEFPIEISLTSWTRSGERFYSAVIRDISERQILERRDLRAYINRIAISALLEVALEPLTLKQKLAVALDIIHTVPRLALLAKGSIMLVTHTGDLELTVERNLSKPLLESCKNIPLGYCLCGRAAQDKEIVFANKIDERHDVSFEGIQPHGHYCVPILSRGDVLGVLNLYVTEGHTRDPDEEAFLATVANTLAGLIERGRAEEKIQHMASHDALTGLPNRVLFQEHLEQELRHAIRTKHLLVVAFLDLDRFKQVNDTLGHEAGDILLKSVTQRLRQCLRDSDTLARIGGDEFTLILPAVDNPTNAANVAEKIIRTLKEPFIIFDHSCQIGVSIGMSCYPDHGTGAEELLQKADQAMYAVKNSGRNAFAFFQPV